MISLTEVEGQHAGCGMISRRAVEDQPGEWRIIIDKPEKVKDQLNYQSESTKRPICEIISLRAVKTSRQVVRSDQS
jgi:hypothetical protein